MNDTNFKFKNISWKSLLQEWQRLLQNMSDKTCRPLSVACMKQHEMITFVRLIQYSSWQYLKKTWKGTLRNTVNWKSVVILHLEKQRELITRFKLKQVYRGNDSTELWSLAILLKKQFPAGSPFEGSYLCFYKEPESLP